MRNMDISGYTSAIATPEIAEAKADTTIEETTNLRYFFGKGYDKMHINPIQYPDSNVVARCAIIHDFLDKNDVVLEMWSRAQRRQPEQRNGHFYICVFLFTGSLSYRKEGKKIQ